MNNLISVIIPVKNGSNYLKEAIEGIKKQNMNIEIIVVDDASDDNTIQIAENLGCKVVKHEISKGQVAGKNSGLKVAKGDYILFHDHDDVMNYGVLAKMYAELSSDENLSAVMAKVKDFISPEITQNNKSAIKPEPYWGLFTGAILIKKESFKKTGYINENIVAGEIIDWKNKMDEENLKIKKLNFISTNRRVHDTNYGKTNQKREYQDYASVLRAKLARR